MTGNFGYLLPQEVLKNTVNFLPNTFPVIPCPVVNDSLKLMIY